MAEVVRALKSLGRDRSGALEAVVDFPDPTAQQSLGSQALQRSVRPGVNPGNARIQGLHYHANTLAGGRNDERNSGHQQAQADRNDARSNPESEHQDDKKRRERQHTPIPRYICLRRIGAATWKICKWNQR